MIMPIINNSYIDTTHSSQYQSWFFIWPLITINMIHTVHIIEYDYQSILFIFQWISSAGEWTIMNICAIRADLRPQKKKSILSLWGFPKMGVPPNHPFYYRIFLSFNHGFWGTSISGNHLTIIPMSLFFLSLGMRPRSCSIIWTASWTFRNPSTWDGCRDSWSFFFQIFAGNVNLSWQMVSCRFFP